jgi:hypothetical protein
MRAPSPAHRRFANPRLVKRDFSYSMDEVASLLEVHENTVRNWMSAGLRGIDDKRPTLIHGTDLIAFIKHKSAKRRRKCAPDECFCFKCREPRKAANGHAVLEEQAPSVYRLACSCEVCGTRMFKAASASKLVFYAEFFNLQNRPPERISGCETSLVNCDLEENDSS